MEYEQFDTLYPVNKLKHTLESQIKKINESVNDFDTIYFNNNIDSIMSAILIKSRFITNNNENAIIKYNDYSVKISFYNHDDNLDNRQTEINIQKLLSKLSLTKQTPHLSIPLLYCYTNKITELLYNHYPSYFKKLYDDYLKKLLHDSSLVIFSKWCKYGDLKKYIKDRNLSDLDWEVVLFKINYTLAVIHEHFGSFRHNDLSLKNILVGEDMETGYTLYYYNGTYYKIPNIGFQIYITDFEFSNITNTHNNDSFYTGMIKEYGIRRTKNQYYDIHFLLNSTRFNIILPKNIQDFIKRIIPKEHTGIANKHLRNYRLLTDDEYTTPRDILKDDMFSKYIIKKETVQVTTDITDQYYFDINIK